jgi:hypothetical protein
VWCRWQGSWFWCCLRCWQCPELAYSLKTAGAGGAWLWERPNGLTVPDLVKFGPLWCLGDSAPLVVTGLDDVTSTFEETGRSPARRTYTSVDSRLIIADFFSRLRLRLHG